MTGKKHFPERLLEAPVAERRDYFWEFTAAHQKLRTVTEELMTTIREPAGDSLIFVYGSSDVGKSTVMKRAVKLLEEEMLDNLKADPGRLAVVHLEAVPQDSTGFSWKDFYIRVLMAFSEVLIDKKIIPASAGIDADSKRTPTAALRRAVEETMKQRRPAALLIDEAQHLTIATGARSLHQHLDTLKSLANITGVPLVLFGTYDLLTARNLSAQLRRRSHDIHFQRYHAESDAEKEAFEAVLLSFQRHLPVMEEPDLVNMWDYIHERTIGLVGTTKRWLVKALVTALKEGAVTVSLEHLRQHEPTEDEVSTMLRDANQGERAVVTGGSLELKQKPMTREELRRALGLENEEARDDSPKPAKGKKVNRNPGAQNPRHYKTGQDKRAS